MWIFHVQGLEKSSWLNSNNDDINNDDINNDDINNDDNNSDDIEQPKITAL